MWYKMWERSVGGKASLFVPTMPDLFTFLPPEILVFILSHIDQPDSLECMRVCHRWYDQVPAYVKHVWNRLHVSTESWEITNDCMLQCLGSHVSRVSIAEVDSCAVLKGLWAAGCHIASLEIDRHAYYDCMTYNDGGADFLATIQNFSNSLTELTITEHPFDTSVLGLLKMLPKLTHLTLLFDFQSHQYGKSAREDTNCAFRSNIVYLHLENVLNIDSEFNAVLHHCPKLRTLIVHTDFGRDDFVPLTPLNFDRIFSLCPLLRYVIWDGDKDSVEDEFETRLKRWKMISSKTSHDGAIGTLRELMFAGNLDGANMSIIQVMKRSQEQLEYLELNKRLDEVAGWDAVAHMRFPWLKILRLTGMEMEENEWIDFLMGCQKLEILDLTSDMEGVRLDRIFAAIKTLKHLQRLRLAIVQHDNPASHPNVCHMLRHNVWLQRIELFNVCVTDQGLLDLCGLRSLQELILDMVSHGKCIGQNGLLAFASELRAVDSNLHTMRLNYLDNITNTVLKRLGQVKALTTLSISSNVKINDVGVGSFIDSNNLKGTSKGKVIYVSGCPGVSRQGAWTASNCS
ncbi:hypothetical protein BJV82DRAFT_620689 [Fennellomyces sp. T-0311]|nr:hypothetical protein BJV82DRAFT_620689 [Fennellomyces sp. T-0311]